jgi:hypothetical protein
MSDRNDELIATLRELGDRTPEATIGETAFVDAISIRIGTQLTPAAHRRRRIFHRVLAPVVAVSLVLIPGPRQALARWLGIGSVQVSRGSTPAGLPPAIRDLDLGRPATWKQADDLLSHSPWKPKGAAPLGVWIEPDLAIVNAVYRIGVRNVLVSELPNDGDAYVLKTIASDGGSIEFLSARGQIAGWISGRPHSVSMGGPRGTLAIPVRLAGSVLIWADASRTIRIEGLSSRVDAVALLASLGP